MIIFPAIQFLGFTINLYEIKILINKKCIHKNRIDYKKLWFLICYII